MNRIVALLSQLLEPAEREAVCGDLEELRITGPEGAVNILGLVIRRQLAAWSHWGPWAALLGVAGLAGFALSESVAQVGTGIFIQLRTYLHYGVAYEPGGVSPAQEIAYLATAVVAMLLWFWASGFVLARLSGRALWITTLLFYCVVRDSWPIRLAINGSIVLKHGIWPTMLFRLLPIDPIMIALLLVFSFGIRSARVARPRLQQRLLVMGVALAFVFLLVWMDRWFSAGFARVTGQPLALSPFVYRILPWLAAALPALLMPFFNDRRQLTS